MSDLVWIVERGEAFEPMHIINAYHSRDAAVAAYNVECEALAEIWPEAPVRHLPQDDDGLLVEYAGFDRVRLRSLTYAD